MKLKQKYTPRIRIVVNAIYKSMFINLYRFLYYLNFSNLFKIHLVIRLKTKKKKYFLEMQEPTKLVAVVGIFFMLLFTAFGAFHKMLTKVFEDSQDEVIGPIYFAAQYTFFFICLFLSPGIKLRCKNQLILASVGYTISFLAGVLLAAIDMASWLKYTTVILCGIISGFSGSIVWPNLGAYIHLICESYDKSEEKGKYYGIFNALNLIQNITGALLVMLVLGFLGILPYFLTILGIAISSVLVGFFFIKDIDKKASIQEGKFSLTTTIKTQASYYPKIKFIIPVMFIEGICSSFINITSFHLIPVDEEGKISNIQTGICFLIGGIGAIVGGYTGGIITDNYPFRISGNLNGIMIKISIGLSYATLSLNSFVLAYSAFASWGYTMAYINSWLFTTISRYFDGKKEAFAIYKQLHCVGIVTYNVVSIATNNSINLRYLLLSIGLLAMPIYIGVRLMDTILNKKSKSEGKLQKEPKKEMREEGDEYFQNQNKMSLITESPSEYPQQNALHNNSDKKMLY